MHVMQLHDFSNIWSIQVHKYINTKVKDAQYVIHRLPNCQVNDILRKLKIQLHYCFEVHGVNFTSYVATYLHCSMLFNYYCTCIHISM